MASKVVIFVVVALLVVAACIGIGYVSGYFTHPCKAESVHGKKHIYNHAPGPCQLVDGVDVGSEDMVVLSSGLVIMTSGMTIVLPRDRPDLLSRKGTLKLFDLNNVEAGAADIPITNEDSFNYAQFNPHGISVWSDETNGVLVYVVNHNYVPDMIETVEKFSFDEGTRKLTHLDTIRNDGSFQMLNNLISTGPETFYFTNFLSSCEPKEVERQLRLKTWTASVGYYDGEKGRLVAEGLRGANGITISPDGEFVYVALYGDESVAVYTRQTNNDLTLYKTYPVHTGLDNLVADGDYVWLGCHADHAKVVDYTLDPDNVQAPSQALRLKIQNGELKETIDVYSNDGSQFSGCAVAVQWKGKVVLGSVFTKALYCDAKYIG